MALDCTMQRAREIMDAQIRSGASQTPETKAYLDALKDGGLVCAFGSGMTLPELTGFVQARNAVRKINKHRTV